jgi:hypothetical protein
VVPDHEVQDDGADDADPDEHVVGVYADVVPLAIDPAPDLRTSVSTQAFHHHQPPLLPLFNSSEGAHRRFAIDGTAFWMADQQ